MDCFVNKYLSKDEIDNQYKSSCKQVAAKILETTINIAMCPKDVPELGQLENLLVNCRKQLVLLENDYKKWRDENADEEKVENAETSV